MTVQKRIAALAAALLLAAGLCALSAAAEGEETVLYHRVAAATVAENRDAWVGNSTNIWTQNSTTKHMGVLRQMCWYNNRNSNGGLAEGEKMQIVIPNVSIPTQGYGDVTLKLIYSHCPEQSDIEMGVVPHFQVWASTDGGETWSESFAGLRSRTMLDTGTISVKDGLNARIFELESEDLTGLVPAGATINALKLRPYGDWIYHYGATRICSVDVIGRAEPYAPEWVDVEEQTMRDLVVARALRTATLPWTCSSEILTTTIPADPTHAIIYPANAPCQGPMYNRQNFTTWERFRAAVDENGIYRSGTDYLTAEGMDCNRFVLDALSAVCTSYRGNWPILMWDPDRLILGDVHISSGQYTDAVVNATAAQTLYESYALVQPGDYLTRFYLASEQSSEDYVWHIRLASRAAEVTRRTDGTIDPAKSYLYCHEITSSNECFWRTPEGETVTWTGLDPVAYQNEHPDYELLLCRACRVDKKYSFSTLRAYKYLVFTLPEYGAERLRAPEVRTVLYLDGDGVRRNGFDPIYNSNWRISRLITRLTDESTGAVLWQEERLPSPATYALRYQNEELDAALAALGPGAYRLTADVHSGPITEVGGESAVSRQVDLAIRVVLPGDLSGDGKVNGKDVVMLQRFMAGGYGVTLGSEADLNGDGKVNGKDVVMLQRYMAGGYGVTLG